MPIGSEIDARRGELEIKTASEITRQGPADGPAARAASPPRMFELRQARRRAKKAAKPVTDLVLKTPPGLSRACASQSTIGPVKGIVRSLSDGQGQLPRDRRRRDGHRQLGQLDRAGPLRGHADAGRTGTRRRSTTSGSTATSRSAPARATWPARALFAAKRERTTRGSRSQRHLLEAGRAVDVAAEVLGRADGEPLGGDDGDERAQRPRHGFQGDRRPGSRRR